jgi:hypothetical protein
MKVDPKPDLIEETKSKMKAHYDALQKVKQKKTLKLMPTEEKKDLRKLLDQENEEESKSSIPFVSPIQA